MSERSLLSEISLYKSANKVSSLEGAITTARRWKRYESRLFISPEALRNETVLNFGCGGSNIGEALREKGVNCNVVDVDLRYNSKSPLTSVSVLLDTKSFLNPLMKTFNLKGEAWGRQFVQADGRHLPFRDQAFDHVLALWSTYQIPKDAKEKVYAELMRVGNVLHIAPIFKIDFEILQRLVNEQNYEIVVCHRQKDELRFSSPSDYEDYVNLHDESERIQTPLAEDAKVIGFQKIIAAGGRGGSTIILRRKS